MGAQDLYDASLLGRMSFIIPAVSGAAFSAQNLLQVDVPAYAACAWTVHLNSFRYSGGALPIGQNQPADNQVADNLFIRALVTWGVDGASETAVVDYYARGCAFQVHGGNIRVSLVSGAGFSTQNAPAPTLSGFIVPAPHIINAIASPTFTTNNLLASAATVVQVPIPARAQAYRVFSRTDINGLLVASIVYSQADNTGTVIQDDAVGYPFSSGTQTDNASIKAGYFPINPFAQFVVVNNTTVGSPYVFYVQFLLDLG